VQTATNSDPVGGFGAKRMLSMHMTENRDAVAGFVAFCMAPEQGAGPGPRLLDASRFQAWTAER
jgi:hypothetical protein